MELKYEAIIVELVYARMRKHKATNEIDTKYFEGMIMGLESALISLGVMDVERAIAELDMKYDR